MLAALVFTVGAALGAASNPQFVFEEHPTLRFSTDTFVLGRMRWSAEHRGPDAALPAGRHDWGFIRRRFSIEGGIGGKVAFEIELDLEGDERWKDVYADYRAGRALTVRGGKFVLPFGYERTTSLEALDFADRSMASSVLPPPRDQGVMAFGALLDGRLRYDAGLFEDGRTLAGRLVARPGAGFEAGASATYGSLEADTAPLRGRTALGDAFFRADPVLSGHRRRVSAHAVYRAGPGALKAEYLSSRDDPDAGGTAMAASGWYASASMVVTGEPDADAHHPRRPLLAGGIGSIEVAARVERLAFDPGPEARAYTAGVTWQPIRFFRIQLNATRDVLPSARAWSRVLRFHLSI